MSARSRTLFRGERGQISTNLINIDKLKLYFGEPFFVSDRISILCPTIKQIVEFGEKEYYSVIHTLTATPSDFKSILWDMQLDWEEITDFQFFTMLTQSLPQNKTRLLLGDVDLSRMKVYPHPYNDGEVVLADKENEVIIDEYIYLKMAEYIRQMHGLKKNIEHAKNKITKMVLLEEDKKRREEKDDTEYKSVLYPLITSVKVRMRYTLDYIKQMNIVEFTTDLQRLNIIRSSDALLKGSYSGFVDTSKIPKKEFDWCREI